MADELFIDYGNEKDLEHRFWVDGYLPRRTLEEKTMPVLDGFPSRESFNDPLACLDEIGSSFAELAEHVTWIKSCHNLTTPPRLQQEDNSFLSANDQGSTQGMYQGYQCQYSSHPDTPIFTQSSVDVASRQIGQPKTEEQLLIDLEGFCEDLAMVESKWTFDHPLHAIKDPLRWYWRALESPGKPNEGQHMSLNTPYCISNYGHSGPWPSSQSSRSQFSGRRGLKSPSSIHTRMGRNEIQSFLKSLKHNIRSNLEHMRNFFDLVSSAMALLDDAKIPVDIIRDELLEWLKKIELLSDQLFERFQRFYSQFLIYALIFFWHFNEFPNSIRHLCTTMPWTIWPALVVLWGVCWMFYPESGSNKAPEGEHFMSPYQQRQLLNHQGGGFGNDTDINLPTTTLPDGTAMPTSPWDFWSTNLDWGAEYQAAQTDAVAPGSIPAVSPIATPFFATTSGRSDIVGIHQSTSVDLSSAVSFSASEPYHQAQTNANLTSQTIGTSNSTNRISRRIKQGPFKCPDCSKTLSRSDSLKRHRNEKHAELVEEFLCPKLGCKKSKKGHGFKRRDKLQIHENSSCKGRAPPTSSNQSTATTPSMAASEPDDTASASFIYEDGRHAAVDTAGSHGGTIQSQDMISELQRHYRYEEDVLLVKEKECQDKREYLAKVRAVIERYENSNTGGC